MWQVSLAVHTPPLFAALSSPRTDTTAPVPRNSANQNLCRLLMYAGIASVSYCLFFKDKEVSVV